MKISSLLAVAGTASVAFAAPTATIEKRADMCGQWDNTVTGPYTLYNNLWGRDDADSGSQCTTLDGLSGSTIKWHAKWTWVGGYVLPTFS